MPELFCLFIIFEEAYKLILYIVIIYFFNNLRQLKLHKVLTKPKILYWKIFKVFLGDYLSKIIFTFNFKDGFDIKAVAWCEPYYA